MTDTFAPPKAPSVSGGLAQAITPRVLAAGFGDGYRQEAGDGLNGIARALDLRWAALSPDDADAIESFFVAQAGYRAFLWAPPGGVERKWKCPNWSTNPQTTVVTSISAHFEQVFDL